MAIWAIADLHLSFGVPEKSMEIFGPEWEKYPEKIEKNWRERVKEDDLVLIAGDISWAMKPEQAKVDLDWIDKLPGTKVILKGNHDYWWSSFSKVKSLLPPSIHAIQNTAFNWNGISITGTRLWDSNEYSFDPYIEFRKGGPSPKTPLEQKDDRTIFARELGRLELGLKELDPHAKIKIVMTHYPPIGADLKPSQVSSLLEKYQINFCIFGHLHSLKKGISLFGSARGIHYYLTSCDCINFIPIQIVS